MKKSILTIVVALVVSLVFASLAVAQGVDPVSASKKALKSKNYSSLLKYSKQVVEEYPDWFWGYYWQGRAYFGQKNYKKAVQAFTASLDAAEKEDEAFQAKYYIVDARYRDKDYKNCLKAITSAERTKRSKYYRATKSKLDSMKGYCHYNLKQYKEAIAAFKPIVDSGKASDDMLKAIGQSYLNVGNTSQAVSVIQAAVRKNPKDIAAHKILVKSYSNSKQWKNAASSAEFALSNFSRDWELNFLAGQAFAKLKNYTKASRYLNASIAVRPEAKTYYKLAEVYAATKEWEKAYKNYDAAQKGYAGDPNFYVNFAYAYVMWVPKNAEAFHNTSKGKVYLSALANADQLLQHALTLKGVNKGAVDGLKAILTNKKDRLEKGDTIVEEYEYELDPETGEMIKKKISSTEEK
jgi:tetratricopeptide (TPR) repeat protein